MIDPRPAIIEKRLKGIKRILLFAGAKGGVGKSMCAAVSALLLAERGFSCGLFDLDFQGASIHLLLGMKPELPDEDRGILPRPAAPGVSVMSMAFFTGDHGLSFRGPQTSEALKELMAVTLWPDTDILLFDMPPGIGDEMLDLSRFIPRAEPLIVITPSILSISVASRLARLLEAEGVPAVGIIANMTPNPEALVQNFNNYPALGKLPLLGFIPPCPDIEECIGTPQRLIKSDFARRLAEIIPSLLP